MTTIHTLIAEPANAHQLEAGLYFIPAHHYALVITQHEGVNVVLQYDTRGPASDFYFHLVTVEWHGRELEFNEVDDARNWIDGELADFGFDPAMEWSSLGR